MTEAPSSTNVAAAPGPHAPEDPPPRRSLARLAALNAALALAYAVLGVLASINAGVVRVYPRARVALLSTGDELVTDGAPLAPGQIRETNQTMLAPLLEAAGCAVHRYGVVADDEDTLERTLRDAATRADAIVTSGGVSMGDYDVVKAVLGTDDIPEIAVTSPTAPGVTHRWTNMTAFTDEVANARIWAGFHYRFSTRVGRDMGLKIGEYIAKRVMQPVSR